jgi:uncharacterized membrane protein SpoIIM required for sporulation
VTLERLIREREAGWRRLDELVTASGGRVERLGGERVLELGSLYRATAADLALVRASHPDDPLRRRLESLVSRAALIVYDQRPRRLALTDFFANVYWRRIAERPRLLLAALVLLLVPVLLVAVWAARDPGAAAGFVPAEFRGAADPPADAGTSAAQEAAFSAFLFTHNIEVTFLCLAAGLAAGIGTAIVLVGNGLLLGAIAGLAIEAGNGGAFLDFIVPHGPLELSCILVASIAGLRLGVAIVDPGNRSRGEALRTEAMAAVEIVLGTMPWLVVAGLSEAFVRGSGLPRGALMTIGLGLFAIFWGLVAWRGWLVPRRRGESTGESASPGRPTFRAAPAPSP